MTTITTDNVPKELQIQIAEAIKLKKQIDEYEKSIKDQLKTFMQENNITSIKNDVFTASIATRETISGNLEEVDPKYIKTVEIVDIDAGKHIYKTLGRLPKGFTSKSTEYLTWRAK